MSHVRYPLWSFGGYICSARSTAFSGPTPTQASKMIRAKLSSGFPLLMTPDTGSLIVPLMHARPRSFKPARSLAATNPPTPLLPFDRPRRLRRHVVDHAVDALDLVDVGGAGGPNPLVLEPGC